MTHHKVDIPEFNNCQIDENICIIRYKIFGMRKSNCIFASNMFSIAALVIHVLISLPSQCDKLR